MNSKLKSLFLLCILTINLEILYSQNPSINSPEYKILTPFEQINGSKSEAGRKEYLALAKYKNEYALLFENVVINDYSIKVDKYDTKNTVLEIKFYNPKKIGSTSYSCNDIIQLTPCEFQPESNSKGFLISFCLPNELAYDLKNSLLSEIKIIEISGNSKLTTPHGPSSSQKNYFQKYSSKITSKKGTYINVDKYKAKPIPLYSLILKNKEELKKSLGSPINQSISKHSFAEYRNDTVLHYNVPNGKYEITFKHNLSYRVTFYPSENIAGSSSYYLDKYFNNGYPFELKNCNCGDYTVKTGSSSSGNLSYDKSLNHYFKDEKVHVLKIKTEGRTIKYAEALVYKDESLLTITKSKEEIFIENIPDTIFSTKAVCELNNWKYDESMFKKIRKQFPETVSNLSLNYSCKEKECAGNVELIIKWISNNGGSSMQVTYDENQENSSCISKQLAGQLKRSLLNNRRPKIYDHYINCNDTLTAKINETTITVLKYQSNIKFENNTINDDLKTFISDNDRNLRIKDNNLTELKVIEMLFDNTNYKIGIIKLSEKELNMFDLKKMKKKYIY